MQTKPENNDTLPCEAPIPMRKEDARLIIDLLEEMRRVRVDWARLRELYLIREQDARIRLRALEKEQDRITAAAMEQAGVHESWVVDLEHFCFRPGR